MKKQTAAKGKTGSKQTTIKNSNMKTEATKTEATKTENKTAGTVSQKDKFILVSPSLLVPNPKNPRIKYEEIESLMKSLVENGFWVPLTDYYAGDKIHLKDGPRRMKAIEPAKEKGQAIARVPVIIVPKNLRHFEPRQ